MKMKKIKGKDLTDGQTVTVTLTGTVGRHYPESDQHLLLHGGYVVSGIIFTKADSIKVKAHTWKEGDVVLSRSSYDTADAHTRRDGVWLDSEGGTSVVTDELVTSRVVGGQMIIIRNGQVLNV